MPDHHRPSGDLTGKVTVAAVIAALACCAIPLLITAGVITSAGVALRNLAVIGLGSTLAAWLVVRAVRSTRQRQGLEAAPPPSDHSSQEEGQPAGRQGP